MKKTIFLSAILSAMTLTGMAQSGTNSPYSQFGIGVLSDQSQGANRGMGGVGIALRNGNRVNSLNPASYSAIDSLSMVFDAGISGQITNFKEGGRKLNANNADLEYAVAAFRLAPHLGASVGLLPLSNIGYNYNSSYPVNDVTGSGIANTTMTETHNGSGGLHQAYVGLGWRAFRQLSVGVNFSYLWGSYNKSVSAQSSDAYVSTVTKTYNATVNSYKLDFGVQWEQPLRNNNFVILGATLGLGHKLHGDSECIISNTDTQLGTSSVDILTLKNGLEIPMTIGVGLAWRHADRYMVTVDYSLQRWGDLGMPASVDNNGSYDYAVRKGLLNDRHKIAVGGEWTPNAYSTKFYNRINYRVGASFATPYYKVNGADGPKEYSVSAGFGLPITNSNTSRAAIKSVLNISGQWTRQSLPGMITENTFRINIGFTFNERWFAKWKFN